MKKTIFLRTEYLDLKGKKLSKTEESKIREKIFQDAIKEFQVGMREFFDNGTLKIIKECFPNPEIVIDYDGKNKDIYSRMLDLDIVEIIDATIFKEEK